MNKDKAQAVRDLLRKRVELLEKLEDTYHEEKTLLYSEAERQKETAPQGGPS